MKVSAKSDYAVRALLELAQAEEVPVKGERLAQAHGAAEHLQTVWIAVRASLRTVVDELTLADVVSGRLPSRVKRLSEAPDAWSRR